MIGSVDLLRKLGSGVRPDGNAEASPPNTSAIEREPFQGLLLRARAGELASGRDVRMAAGGDVEFDQEMMSRLSEAADAAQAAGAERLLAWVDGRVVGVDLGAREARAIDRADGEILTGFDAAVILTRESPDAARILPAPGALPCASLAEALARDVRSGGIAAGDRAAG